MKTKDAPPLVLTYTNHRGETGVRRIIPLAAPWWGQTDWHLEPQWLLRAFDVDKQAEREFALEGFGPSFQARVQPWMMACFGPEVSGDREERNHRFLEEALELVQACGCTASEAHQLVDYTFARDVGEPSQETGGVMVTLAALCLANDLDMHEAAETELARIWTKVEKIRAKQAAKPKHSPLPEGAPPVTDTTEAEPVAEPYCYVIGGADDAKMNGWVDARLTAEGEFQLPLYASPEAALRTSAPEPADASGMTPLDQGWQPIATAPKDGTRVLIAVTGHFRAELAEYNQELNAWETIGAVVNLTGGRTLAWHPLPAPPTPTPPEVTREGEVAGRRLPMFGTEDPETVLNGLIFSAARQLDEASRSATGLDHLAGTAASLRWHYDRRLSKQAAGAVPSNPAPAPGREDGEDDAAFVERQVVEHEVYLALVPSAANPEYARVLDIARRAQTAGPDDGTVSEAEVDAAHGELNLLACVDINGNDCQPRIEKKYVRAALEAARKATPAPGAKHG